MNSLEQLANQATEGLKADPELRLDVEQELLSHLQDTAEARRDDGLSEAESQDRARKAFGPATDIAAELVNANHGRMRLRGLCRLAAQALLVPLSLVVAAWVAGDMIFTGRVARMLSAITYGGGEEAGDPALTLCRKGLPEETRFLFFGDESLESKVDRQRSIWERDPTNRIYYGNYISTLLGSSHEAEDGQEVLKKEIRRGQELDPENARYDYLLAGILLDDACDLDNEKNEQGEYERVLKIRDRDLLDKAMAQMVAAGRKPFLNSYVSEMTAERMSLLPPEETLIEYIGRVGFLAGILLPDVSKQMKMARVSVEYGKILEAEGRREEAIPILEAWYPLSARVFENSFTLVEVLVGFAIAATGEKSAEVLESMGETDRAAEMMRRSQAIQAPSVAYKARIKQDDDNMDDMIKKHGGILHGLLLPAIGESVTKEDLAGGRKMEHTMIERAWLVSFVTLLVAVMLGVFIIAMVLRFGKGGEAAPILLLPPLATAMRIMATSVLVPLAIFFVYTRYSGIAGREYSRVMWPRFIFELFVLSLTMLSLSVYQLQKFIHRRCSEIGIEAPAEKGFWMIVALCILPIVLIVWIAAGAKKFALYRGTLSRSLIPITAAVIIVVGLLSQPYLRNRERYYIQNDPILSLPEKGGFTRIEVKVTERLAKEALDAIAEIEKEAETH